MWKVLQPYVCSGLRAPEKKLDLKHVVVGKTISPVEISMCFNFNGLSRHPG